MKTLSEEIVTGILSSKEILNYVECPIQTHNKFDLGTFLKDNASRPVLYQDKYAFITGK